MYLLQGSELSARQKKINNVRLLDYLDTQKLCGGLRVFTPTAEQIKCLIDRAKFEMPILASTEIIQRVARDNPDAFWALRRTGSASGEEAAPGGFVAFLMLNEKGRDALLNGKLNAADPIPDYLVGQHERPTAIYVWALHARGCLTPALALVMDKLQSPNYRMVDFVARAATAEGASFLKSIGFVERTATSGISFHHYQRQYGRSAPQLGMPKLPESEIDDTRLRNTPRVAASMVHKFEQFMQAIAVRSAVYVGEEKCPFDEEFDGNDFSATQILGTVGVEPAGCLRIRYFAKFAKFERLAVREEFRKLGVARSMIEYAIELCRLKGYEVLNIHSRNDKTAFWSNFGFERIEDRNPFFFSDFEYVEMKAVLGRHACPITMGVDPYILVRPEGKWDTAGGLELSALRSMLS